MTTITRTGPSTGSGAATRASSKDFANWTIALRFLFRRNWVRMLVWVLVLAGLIAIVIVSQRQTFPTQADRTAYAAIANTPSVAALTGLPYAAGTLGGILIIKIWMTDAIALAFAVIFLISRNGRAEEESGRTELMRSGALGRHAYTLANWLLVALFTIVVGLACAGAAIGEGLPVYGSFVMGASYTGVGLTFLGIAALTGQLSQTSRGANGVATIILAISYLLRAGGDLAAKHEVAGGASWASPIGWGQAMRSYGSNNWAPFALLVGSGLVLCLVSLRLEATRDLGAGLLPDRAGARTASRLTRTPVGLTLRLQRWSILGWAVGILIGGLFFGNIATAFAKLLHGNTSAISAILGSQKNVVEGLLGYFTMADALLAAAFVLQSIATLRAEEADGGVELQWTGAISRIRWAASRIAVPAVVSLAMLALSGWAEGASYGAAIHDPSQGGRFTAIAIAYWPTMLLVIGIVVFLSGWLPRVSLTISWVIYGVIVLISMFAELFKLPKWLANNTPFTAVQRLTDGHFSVVPLLVILVIAIVLAVLGLLRLRSRDYVTA
ncbi:MAG TPA: ABC transporter permease [Galbitalea sp.]|jgi:ABC-2 type transport system permease protein|nr:ABC transporter permease [Galbitalea sp.]